MSEWQPIETAPKDRTYNMTDKISDYPSGPTRHGEDRHRCNHEWVFIALGEVATTTNFRTKQCQKCGVKTTRAVTNGERT
jgi:hypothetical protein